MTVLIYDPSLKTNPWPNLSAPLNLPDPQSVGGETQQLGSVCEVTDLTLVRAVLFTSRGRTDRVSTDVLASNGRPA